MRGDVARGASGGNKRRKRHILEQPWSKYRENLGKCNGARGTCSRVRG